MNAQCCKMPKVDCHLSLLHCFSKYYARPHLGVSNFICSALFCKYLECIFVTTNLNKRATQKTKQNLLVILTLLKWICCLMVINTANTIDLCAPVKLWKLKSQVMCILGCFVLPEQVDLHEFDHMRFTIFNYYNYNYLVKVLQLKVWFWIWHCRGPTINF